MDEKMRAAGERNHTLILKLLLTEINSNNTNLLHNSYNKEKEQFLIGKNVS